MDNVVGGIITALLPLGMIYRHFQEVKGFIELLALLILYHVVSIFRVLYCY